LFNHEVAVTGSGRTDAGVHAHAQVASVQTIRTMDGGAIVRGTNALLSHDIRVLTAEDVGPEFHARRSARSKTYRYRICRNPIVSPFEFRYVYAFRYPLDDQLVDFATRCFLGTHDFTSFCATATEVEDRTRTIYDARWTRSETEWVFNIRGSGFLQYMVRTIVGTLLDVGQRRIPLEKLPAIFEARNRRLAGPTAPASGLHLMKVDY
jgi:tRNA pseudouridine38-40 synthase